MFTYVVPAHCNTPCAATWLCSWTYGSAGLDARAAAIVMRTVRNIVNTGRTIVCTIHQPSIDIFESFDELLLLKRGGETIFNGQLGVNSDHLIEYFQASVFLSCSLVIKCDITAEYSIVFGHALVKCDIYALLQPCAPLCSPAQSQIRLGFCFTPVHALSVGPPSAKFRQRQREICCSHWCPGTALAARFAESSMGSALCKKSSSVC